MPKVHIDEVPYWIGENDEPGLLTYESDMQVDEERFETALSLARATNYGTLKRGSSDKKAIRALQNRLSYLGYGLENDGIFGPKTEEALRQFQESRNAQVDGIVGPETLGKLLRAHPKKPNDADPSIDAIQKVVLPGAARSQGRTGRALGGVKAEQRGGGAAVVRRHPGESAQASRTRRKSEAAGQGQKGPHGGAIDPVTGKEFGSRSTGPIGSTQPQQPTNMTFEEAHPRGPGGQFIQKGSTGKQVRHTQSQLNRAGVDTLKEDGQFGDHTDAAVRRFQTQAGITVDGIVGPQTRQALRRHLRTQKR